MTNPLDSHKEFLPELTNPPILLSSTTVHKDVQVQHYKHVRRPRVIIYLPAQNHSSSGPSAVAFYVLFAGLHIKVYAAEKSTSKPPTRKMTETPFIELLDGGIFHI